jgi:hypothetical protein
MQEKKNEIKKPSTKKQPRYVGGVDREVFIGGLERMSKFEQLCNMLPADVNWGDPITPQMVEEIVMAEREACAKVCDAVEDGLAWDLAEEIRERSNVKLTGAEPRFSAERPC